MSDQVSHIPVMQKEVLEFLHLSPEACFVDCTVGLGGHARLVAQTLNERGRIIGIDKDKESLEIAQGNLSEFPCRCDFIHDDFKNIDRILNSLGIEKVDAMLFDLGISSFQLENPGRGFSIQSEGPLDMRMNQDNTLSAFDVINSLSEREIATILKEYGEERMHYRIARFLVAERARNPIRSTKELRDIVLRALPHSYKRQRIHPATRTFQAVRIFVNRELESLEMALNTCINYLRSGARICVISFHSLEDRIVKHTFRSFAKENKLQLIVKKPVRPSETEVQENTRARSARLRVAERI